MKNSILTVSSKNNCDAKTKNHNKQCYKNKCFFYNLSLPFINILIKSY